MRHTRTWSDYTAKFHAWDSILFFSLFFSNKTNPQLFSLFLLSSLTNFYRNSFIQHFSTFYHNNFQSINCLHGRDNLLECLSLCVGGKERNREIWLLSSFTEPKPQAEPEDPPRIHHGMPIFRENPQVEFPAWFGGKSPSSSSASPSPLSSSSSSLIPRRRCRFRIRS